MDAATQANSTNTIWYVYDGECLLCRTAAAGLRIREAAGQLIVVNARTEREHPLLQEIKALRLNLDEGPVIKCGERCYHGAQALQMMGLLSTNRGWFNRMNWLLFRSKTLCRLCYPTIRGARNMLLKLHGVSPINNLNP